MKIQKGDRVRFAMALGSVDTGVVQSIDGEDVTILVKLQTTTIPIHRYRSECRPA